MPSARGGLRGGFRGRKSALLQDQPSAAATPARSSRDAVNWVIQRISVGGRSQEFGWFAQDNAQAASRPITFGYNVHGDLYYLKNTPPGEKLPAVVWLHSYSYPLGYMWVYHRDLHPVLRAG